MNERRRSEAGGRAFEQKESLVQKDMELYKQNKDFFEQGMQMVSLEIRFADEQPRSRKGAFADRTRRLS